MTVVTGRRRGHRDAVRRRHHLRSVRPLRHAPPPAPPDVPLDLAHAPPPLDVAALCARWRSVLDRAADALHAAGESLPSDELAGRRTQLAAERDSTLRLLRSVARQHGTSGRFLHLTPRAEARRLLGLPAGVRSCVFNLDGALVDSAELHAVAWTQTFDEFIWAREERTGGRWAPFNPRIDYGRHMHGRTRLEGVRAFLASRGISLPEGRADDPPGAETVRGLANRKNEVLRRRLDERGVTPLEGAVTYLEAAGEAGIGRAIVSASANTPRIVERAGLVGLVDRAVDGSTMVERGLRPKPAPDTLLAACEELGVVPKEAAAFEATPAGVTAARAAGLGLVVGVDQFGQAGALRAAGADIVVPGLAELLERRLAA